MGALSAGLIAAVALTSSVAKADDAICGKIETFRSSRFDGAEMPAGRRWVELHWRGAWLVNWGFTCLHSPDGASVALCQWLMDKNVSFEFRSLLPQRILTCYGYRFPKAANWSDWKSTIALWQDDDLMTLEIDFADLDRDEGAVRLSAFAPDKDDSGAELPPLMALPPLSDDAK